MREIDPHDDSPIAPFDEADDPTTEFVRAKLQALKSDRGALFSLTKRSGIAGGYFTKLLKDEAREMRVGIDFVRKFAPALGYVDLGEFFLDVGKWWDETGRALVNQYREPETIADAELRRAVESAKGVATPEVVQRAMAEYPNQIGKQDWWWWIQRMTEIAKEIFQEKGSRVVQKKLANEERRKVNAARVAAPESSRTLANEAPSAPPSAPAAANDRKSRRR